VVRLYADRWLSSHRHNLLRGLAWLHEALAAPDLDAATRRSLELESAWHWLELARGELTHEALRSVYPAARVLLARAEALLSSHAEDPQARIIRAWIRLLRSDEPSAPSLVGWPVWSLAMSLSSETYEGLRARESALGLVAQDTGLTAEQAVVVLRTISSDISGDRTRLDDLFTIERLRILAAELAARFEIPFDVPDQPVRSHRTLARHLGLMNARAIGGSPADQRRFQAALENDVDALEGALWGYPSDRSSFWRSSGTPGRAWHGVMGAYSAAKLQRGLHDTAVHFIASIQMGADLRVGVLNAWARMVGMRGEDVMGPSRLARARELLLQNLDDAAHLTDGVAGNDEPYERDPFRWSAARLHALTVEDGPLALTGWGLADSVRIWSSAAEPHTHRTAAFAVEHIVGEFDRIIAGDWTDYRQRLDDGLPAGLEAKHLSVVESLVSCFEPNATLREVEEGIRSIAEHHALLGVFVGALGELQVAAVWRHAGGLFQRVFRGPPARALEAARALGSIVGPCRGDDPELSHLAPARSPRFEDVRAPLEEGLEQVLPPDALSDAPRPLLVLAPGPLRGAPWSALRVRERPLRATFSSISLLPHIGFERPQRLMPPHPVEPHTVCALGVDQDDPGAAVIETLRRLHRVEATAEPTGPITSSTIVEVDVIDAHAPEIRDLRLYGSRSPWTVNATSEGLELLGGRVYTTRNMSRTRLPRCVCVELWAATGSVGEARAIRTADRDAMPSLVRSFLQAGAGGVLDLAWPVPALVKALVCEAFGLHRAYGETPGARALNDSLRETEVLLRSWHEEMGSAPDRRAAFDWLDHARRHRVQRLGGDPALVVPFPVPSTPTEVDPASLIATCSDELHLAAFRWWGA